MLRTKIAIAILGIFSLLSLASAAEYWVAFGHGEIWNDQQVIYVTKIDDQGHVLVPPTNVWQSTPFNDGVPSLTNGPNGQVMVVEIATQNNPITHPPQKIRIARSIFTKDTLTTTAAGFQDINYKDGFNMQSSQKPTNNLAVGNPTGSLPEGLPFTSDGTIFNSWRLIPRISKVFIAPWGITADGLLGYALLFDGSTTAKVYVQPLNGQGLPSGLPSVGATSTNGMGSVDISNPLPGGIRYLIDRKSSGPPAFTLFIELWKINAVTGKKMSKPKFLVDSSSDFVQNLAIDPDGQFFLYKEIGPTSCPPGSVLGSPFPSERLWFQKLGPGGTPTGDRVLVVDCGDVPGGPGAIDIMKAD